MINPFDKYLSAEDRLHIAICEYVELQYPKALFYHCPNEGNKKPFERYKCVKLRTISGVPDLIFAEAKWNKNDDFDELIYNGLYIELKVIKTTISPKKGSVREVKGVVSDNQQAFLDKLTERGYLAVVCYTFNEAKAVIDKYFEDWEKPLNLKEI